MVEALFDLSVVERANSSLAVALTGRPDAGDVLLRAEARGLFVSRIGPEGWFAMHSLVRTVLMDELARRSPARLAQQQRRAASWFEDAGEVPLALDYLIAAGEPRRALRLLAAEHANLYDTGRETTTLRTIAAIPTSTAAADLPSMIEFAWCHLLVSRRRFLEIVEQATWWASSVRAGRRTPGAPDDAPVDRGDDPRTVVRDRSAGSPGDARPGPGIVEGPARPLRLEHDHTRGGADGMLGRRRRRRARSGAGAQPRS